MTGIHLKLSSALLLWFFSASLCVPPATGQVDTSRDAGGRPVKALKPAAVMVDGDTLYLLHYPLGEFLASERAHQISAKIRLLIDNEWPLDSLRMEENEGVTDVLLDSLRVFSVTRADASIEGKTRNEVVLERQSEIKTVVTERRNERSMEALLTAIGMLLLFAVLLLVVFWLMKKAFPVLYGWIDRIGNKLFPTIKFRGRQILTASSIRDFHLAIAKGIRFAISLFLLYSFLAYALSVTPWTRAWDLAPVLQQILIAIALTVAAWAVAKSGQHLFGILLSTVSTWKGTIIKPIRFKNVEVASEERLMELMKTALALLRYVLAIVLTYVYVTLLFSVFDFSRTWASKLIQYVVDPLTGALGAFLAYLPNIFFILVIVVITRLLIKVVHFGFREVGRGTIALPGFHKEWTEPTYKIVRFLMVAFALIMIFPYLPGSDSPAFQGVTVFLGILFSLGSTSAIANIVAGLVLTYMRPFVIGNRVKIADTMGDVVEKTLLVTRVRTVKNVDVTIPNAMVLGSHIINYTSTHTDRPLILHTQVTIGYDVPWRKVQDLLLKAAGSSQNILSDPKPFVLQTALDDFYVKYELNVYTDKPSLMTATYSQLHQNVQDQFNEAGLEIMSPHYSAIRDGNKAAIPETYLPKTYTQPPFRLENILNPLRDPKVPD